MNLQPAFETVLRHGDHAVTLRADLRAAVALDNLPGGIPGASLAVMRQTYTGIRAVILATATDRAAALSLMASLSEKPLGAFVESAQEACLTLLVNLLPKADETASTTPAKDITLRDYLDELFKFASIVLDWQPSEIWQASPLEIETILRAHVERQERIEAAAKGEPYQPAMSQEQRQENAAAGLDPDFDRNALRALKARHNG